MTDPTVLTVPEVAALFRVSTWTVAAMVRDGRLPRVPGIRRTRIPATAVQALLEGVYDAVNESNGQASPEAAASRRRQRAPKDGSLAGEAVGGRGALHRCIGSAPGDVDLRIVKVRGR